MFNFLNKKKSKKKAVSQKAEKRIEELESSLESVTERLNALEDGMQKVLMNVGMVRYDAFEESGGAQSFSVALLDQGNNGVVITSHYGRESMRVYGKPIKNGSSKYAMSKEEQKAIDKAVKVNQ